jgi:hypothetical protein
VNIASDDGFPMQCVPVLASTTYNFGAWFKVATDGGVDLCQIVFYDSGCGGAALGFFNLNVGGIKNAWLLASSSAMSPVATQYASIGCQGGNFKMDKLFVTPAPDTY